MVTIEGKRKTRQKISVLIFIGVMLCVLIVPAIAAQSNSSGVDSNASITIKPVQSPTTFSPDLNQITHSGMNSNTNPVLEKSIIDKKNLTESQKKLSTALLLQTSAYRNLQAPKNIVSAGKPVNVYVDIKPGYSTHIIDPLVSEVSNRDETHNLAVARLDPQNLEALASLGGVRMIREVIPPVVNSGSVTTLGDGILKTANVRQIYGDRYAGAGMKIGIISDGVEHIAESQVRGDLPLDVTVLSNNVGGDEGTAMLEIVHDMVPDAKLYFHDYGGNTIGFNAAIDELVAANCTVICDDISWLSEPYFQDGYVAEHVKNVTANKPILYISSAGNAAQSHYYGVFSSLAGTPYHDFSRGTDGSHPRLYVDIPAYSTVIIVLQWDDVVSPSWFGPYPLFIEANDYDLYLSDRDRQNPAQTIGDLGLSENLQGSGSAFPYESIIYRNPGSTSRHAEIDVKKFNAVSKTLNLYVYGGTVESYNVNPNYSIYGHAAVPDAIAVAAVPAGSPSLKEPFSSQGPVRIIPSEEIRQKPDISAVDGVSVTGAGGFPSPFYGTSAAAPHIAGVVAQYWGSHPTLLKTDVKKALFTSAVDLGIPGTDTLYGNGLADALTMQRPTAEFRGNPTVGPAPLTVWFSDRSRGSPTGWTWYFGDETYTGPWTQESAHAFNESHFLNAWYARYKHSSVALPDGSIVLMGGTSVFGSNNFISWNDAWKSTNNGETWTPMTYNAGWSARGNFSSVAMPDGSIILMGGRDSTSLRNDVWRSRDNGGNWSLVTANAGWSPRDQFSAMVLPDGGILVMGGYAADGRKNDVWWSADYGSHWTLVNAHAPWQARFESSSVALADGSIILMGGRNDSTYFNDAWQSTDHGASWTQMTANAPWSKRSGLSAVPMPDGSIVLMGGGIGMSLTNDVWRSLDHGAAWTQVTPVNRWPARSGHSAVVMQDGTIVIMSGFADGFKCIDDTWSLTTAGSFQKNPSHTFTRGGTHMITLQANTSYGYNSQRKIGYVTVSEPVADFSGLPVSGNAPLTVYFTDKSVGASITRRIWDFGDGTTASHIDLRNFMKTYTTPGTYNVTLKVMQGSGDSSGYATLTRTNYITVNSAASFVTNITAGITPLAVSFTDTSIISAPTMWHWNFGDGSWFETTRSSERNPTHIYATAGTYTAYLTVSNRDGSSTSPGKTITVHTDSNPITPGSSQIAISRPSTGYWYFDYTLDGAIDNSFRYGESTDQIIKGDWDGDGKDGIATFRSSTGYWYFDYNLDGVVDKSFRYGGSTDRIIAGKWQGTQEGIAIFRPSTGYWYFDYNLDGVVDKSFRYGGSSDQIIRGDWDGDGKDGIAIFRPSTGYWYFDYNLDGVVDKSFRYGGSTDRIIAGKWQETQEGIAIFRPSTGYWYFDYNLDGVVDKSFRYGGSTDQIIKGDWDGDGKDGIAIFRPSTGYWYFDYNLDGVVDKSFRYGGSTDRIITGNWG